jgi:tight adherence protein B
MAIPLIFLSAAATVIVFFAWLRNSGETRQQTRQIKRRMGVKSIWDDAFDIDDEEMLLDPTIELPERRSMVIYFGDIFDATERAKAIREKLIQADINLKPSEAIGALVVFALLSYILAEFLLRQGPVVNIPIALICSIVLPWFFMRARRNRRLENFTKQLPIVCELVSNGLRAGLALQGALELVAREMPSPAKDEFGRLVREVRLGGSIDESLEALLVRMPSEALEIMVTALRVQRIAGGNLIKSMAALSRTLFERQRTTEEIKTMLAQPRFASYLMPVLSIAALSSMNYMTPGFIDVLFDTLPGLLVLGLFILTQICGFLLIQRITRIKV